MDYTYCTIIIAAADQAAAQKDYPFYFFVGLSPTGAAPATNYVQSGPIANTEMNDITNEQVWAKRMYFGENSEQPALDALGLKVITEPIVQPVMVAESV